METKGIWAWLLIVISIFCLYSATTCMTCFGCKPTLLEPCSVTFLLVFLMLFAWAIGLLKQGKIVVREVRKTKKKKR